jgi:hypothetical protein
LLLLLARVVELGLGDSSIAAGLDLLFRTAFSSVDLFAEAVRQEAILLLTRILRSEICRAGNKRAILNFLTRGELGPQG